MRCAPTDSTLRGVAGVPSPNGILLGVDGDTIEMAPAVEGLADVRLTGVDAPETSHPTYGEQPYGQEAKTFTTARLEGERVIQSAPLIPLAVSLLDFFGVTELEVLPSPTAPGPGALGRVPARKLDLGQCFEPLSAVHCKH